MLGAPAERKRSLDRRRHNVMAEPRAPGIGHQNGETFAARSGLGRARARRISLVRPDATYPVTEPNCIHADKLENLAYFFLITGFMEQLAEPTVGGF